MHHHTPSRRSFLSLLGLTAAMPLFATACRAATQVFPVHYTEAEWRKRLTPAQFAILREKSTERPFTSALLKEHRKGQFLCAADGNPLFDAKTKYDSGTGWPSFWRPLNGAVQTTTDYEIGYARTEVHCAKCGGHLGHVFDDGPMPTGQRYCMNGDALIFKPA